MFLKWQVVCAAPLNPADYLNEIDMEVAVKFAYAVVFFGPPHMHTEPSVVGALRSAGVELRGAHPAPNSGFNMALLPVARASDVCYVTLPFEGLPMQQLRLLGKLPNLESVQVECDRRLTLKEYMAIHDFVPTTVTLPRYIRGSYGKVGPTHRITASFQTKSK